MKQQTIVIATILLAAACGGKSKPEKRGQQLHSPPVEKLETVIDNEPMTAPPLASPVVAPVAVPEPEPTTYSEMMKAGKELEKQGRIDDALAMFEKAASKKETSSRAKIEVARALIGLDRLADARTSIEQAIEINDSSSYAWNTLGRVELADGNMDEAIEAFSRATEINEDNSYAWNNLGLSQMKAESFEAAVESLENATSGQNPTSYMWNNLGHAYEHVNKLDEARAAYSRGADMGSAKAQASLKRLEGVESIVASPEPEDGTAPVELAPADAEVAIEKPEQVDPK